MALRRAAATPAGRHALNGCWWWSLCGLDVNNAMPFLGVRFEIRELLTDIRGSATLPGQELIHALAALLVASWAKVFSTAG